MLRRFVVVTIIVVALLVLFSGFPALVNLLTDWWWFQTVGYQSVFLTSLGTKFVLGFGVGILAFAFFILNLRFAQRGLVPDPLVINVRAGMADVDLLRILKRLSWPVALLFGFLFGVGATTAWLPVQNFLHRTPFGVTDPVFGRDVGYYVFTLPVLEGGLSTVIGAVVIAAILSMGLYVLRRDVVLARRHVAIEPAASLHLGVLLGLIFLLVAVNVYFVRMPSLLYSNTGPLTGASYTDLKMQVPFLWISLVVALLGAVFVFLGVRSRRLARHAAIAVAAYIGVSIVGAVSTQAFQKLVVVPNELVKEAPQLQSHIAATRHAWGIDSVDARDLSGESGLTLADIQRNRGTIRNVRLWDRDPLLQTFGQLQEIRTYYDFVSVDDDRYWIDGEYRQVLLSPRELNVASLPTRTFINERFTFTHGMGLTLGPVNEISEEGLPVLFIKDLPPTSSVSLKVTRPQIYYGELSNDWVFVGTNQEEFDYPSDEGNVFTAYTGTGGVPVGSMFRQLIYSLHFGQLKIMLSNPLTPDSRVMYHRRVMERVSKALPFLSWDSDPYIVVTDSGQLKWVIDAYTSTGRYPYSRRAADGTNYVRNSVKVVLDAYDGDMHAYVADPNDPLIQTYEKVFDGIFEPLDSMPQDLRAHIRYPEGLFRIQTSLYATYHMDVPDVFYHREDEWQIPTVSRAGDSSRDPYMRHIILKLPGEQSEEYIVMTPFTPRGKDNLAAWMIVRNDGDHYGQLVVYRFPRQSLVYGPTQVLNRINQNTEISQQLSLWDQRGSQVVRGNLLVIPIEESLVFVQALYLRAEGGRIPELKRVIVAYEDRVVMSETLEESLRQLFGGDVDERATPSAESTGAPVAPSAAATIRELARQASEHYDRAVQAQRVGDWATYGEEMRQVGELLRQMSALAGGG